MRTIPRGRRIITDIVLATSSATEKSTADRSDLSTLGDPELLAAIKRGIPNALTELYERHGPSVRRHAHDLFGAVDGERVTHSVFLSLWRADETVLKRGESLRELLRRSVERRTRTGRDETRRRAAVRSPTSAAR